MKSQTKSMLSSLSRQELVHVCNEKLVWAARDLAEFTKQGINARYIVDNAHKCEKLENMLKQSYHMYQKAELQVLENDLRAAVIRICETGRKIWQKNKAKYNNYVILCKNTASEDLFPEPGVNAA